jgi:hypothetical protein
MCSKMCVALCLAAGSANAALVGSAELTPQNLGGGQFRYAGVVNNTGTTTIGTFWFAWIPGQNYLATLPTNVVAPAGWTSLITNGGATDGWGIRWTANSAASFIQPGNSLSGFRFDSVNAPTVLNGNSPFYPAVPMLTSFVYVGAAFADPGSRFVATVIPAPASAILLSLAALPIARRRR